MDKLEIVVATNNLHKLEEIKAILSPYNISLYSLNDMNIHIEVEENGSTYQENALIKAREIAKYTSLIVLSDDSGINIEALDNGPGIYSARYSSSVGGYHNAFKIILEECQKKNNYKALFNCDIAVMNLEEEPLIFEGRIPGHIAKEIDGNNGFGFDPIFISDAVGKTNASLTKEEKNRFSARAAALNKFINYLKDKNLIK